jgi:HEAT repeat protein
MKTKNLFLILTILIFSFISVLSAQNSTEDLKNLLGKLESYDYGQSRENLTLFSDLLRVIGNSDSEQLNAEKQMINFLESDATLPAKQFICECLSIYGSDESVPVLEEMLSEQSTENMALYALERIPTEKASEVLMDALSDAKGDLQVGIINALGNRRFNDSVEQISRFIWDSDSKLAYASISAIGKIGGDEAAESLAKALADPDVKLKAEVIQASLRCAMVYEQNQENKKALTIYQSLENSTFDHQVRHAALKGIISASGKKATDILVEFFDNESSIQYAIAIPLVREIPASEDVSPIVDHLTKMDPDQQIKLIGAMAGRKESAVFNAMVKLTKSNNEQVRIAALEALSLSGEAETALLFVGVAAGSKGLDRTTARAGLDRLSAPGTDKLIVKSIPESDDARKIELIRSTSSRNITSAAPLLIYQLENTNSDVRIASIKSLREIASPNELDALIVYHLKVVNDQEFKELENTIVATCKRIPENQSRSAILLSNLSSVDNLKIKSSYLEMMGKIGDPKSLPVLKEMLNSNNEQLQTSAIRGLANWLDIKPAPDLLNIAKSSKNQKHRTLALRGYLDLLNRDESIKPDDKTEMYKESMNLVEGTAEKRQVLSGLAKTPTLESFNYVKPYLDDPDVKNEAETAILRLAWELGADHMETTLPVVKKVKDQTDNDEIREQINNILEYIEGNEE